MEGSQNIVDRIRALGKTRNMSLPVLESELGLGNGTISRWSKSAPNTDKLSKVADYFHVSIDYLLGKTVFRNAHEMLEYWGSFDPYFEAYVDFGYLIKKERENQSVSVEEMSAGIGITKQDLEDCEAGLLPINKELADKMAAFLDTDVSQILFDNDLYPDEVPEEYHDRVLEWEELCAQQEAESRNESATSPVQLETPTEHKLKLLARHLDKIPDEQRQRLIENFSNSIDIYLDAMGIPKEDE